MPGEAEATVRRLHTKLNDPAGIRPLQGLGITALPNRVFVYTTNVDGFFLRAGFRPEEVEKHLNSNHHMPNLTLTGVPSAWNL